MFINQTNLSTANVSEDPVLSDSTNNADMTKNFDFLEYAQKLMKKGELALTGDSFFVGGRRKLDYHKSFDRFCFFKYMVRVRLAFPYWCMQLQRLKEEGKLEFQYAEEHDFFDWKTNTVCRDLVEWFDNAPYHVGVGIYLCSLTKGQIADLLRDKCDVTEIEFKHIDKDGKDVMARAEVPDTKKNHEWKAGWPTVTALQDAALKIIMEKNINLLLPPYVILLDPHTAEDAFSDKHLWGSHRIMVFLQAAYTPKWWAIELKWAVGKNYVAEPEQQVESVMESYSQHRSSATVVDQLRRRWFQPAPNRPMMWKLFRHCEAEMNQALKEYAE